MAVSSLPRLLDRRQLAIELNVKLATAETLMRKLPKVKVGARVFVKETDVQEFLKKEART